MKQELIENANDYIRIETHDIPVGYFVVTLGTHVGKVPERFYLKDN